MIPIRSPSRGGKRSSLFCTASIVTHGIKTEAFNVRSDDIKKDMETEVRFTPQQAGHFEAQCSRFCGKGHGTMKLQIDVVP